MTSRYLLEDGTSAILLEDGSSLLLDAPITEVTTGLSSETDTAYSLTASLIAPAGLYLILQYSWGSKEAIQRATGLSSETDASLAVTRTKKRAAGLGSETDTSLAVTRTKKRASGLSSETDTSLAVSRKKSKVAGLSSETDTSYSLAKQKSTAAGRSDETDSSLTLTVSSGSGPTLVDVGLSEETDTSITLKLFAAGFYLPFGFKWGYALVVKVAIETDTAVAVPLFGTKVGFYIPWRLPMGASKWILSYGRGNETDTAFARPRYIRTVQYDYEIAGEEYDVYSLVPVKFVTPGIAVETDEAVELTLRVSAIDVGLSSTVDYSLALRIAWRRAVERANETDTAYRIPRGIGRITGLATEQDMADRLAINAQFVATGYAAETNVSFALLGIKSKYVQRSVEVDTALTLVGGQIYATTVYAWKRIQ